MRLRLLLSREDQILEAPRREEVPSFGTNARRDAIERAEERLEIAMSYVATARPEGIRDGAEHALGIPAFSTPTVRAVRSRRRYTALLRGGM